MGNGRNTYAGPGLGIIIGQRPIDDRELREGI